ncbi:hypothetical protein [Nonomuraea salmonea]|uniref:hypothetical protein n=1 Tax=Nonomuraea salmonea TaxID=46181 RepID=UPI0031ED91F6
MSSTPSTSTWALLTASSGTAGHHAQHAAVTGSRPRPRSAASRASDVPTASSAPPAWSALWRLASGESRCTTRKYASARGG